MGKGLKQWNRFPLVGYEFTYHPFATLTPICNDEEKEGYVEQKIEQETSRNEIKDVYMTFEECVAANPMLTKGNLKWWRFNNYEDFNQCVAKIGKRVFIHKAKFEKWLSGLCGQDCGKKKHRLNF